jgi:hypothetical protein
VSSRSRARRLALGAVAVVFVLLLTGGAVLAASSGQLLLAVVGASGGILALWALVAARDAA